MRWMLAVLGLLVISATATWAGEAEPELKPMSAVEAEERVRTVRDALTDMLWLNTEDHWHNGRWDEAIRLCRQIVQIDPHFVEAYNGAAWMLWSSDRDEEAIELFELGIAANPKRHEIYHDYGMYLFHEKKYLEAAEMFRKSVETDAPMYYQHMLPNSLERAGKRQEALDEWRRLRKRFPEDPIPGRHIGRLEEEMKAEAD